MLDITTGAIGLMISKIELRKSKIQREEDELWHAIVLAESRVIVRGSFADLVEHIRLVDCLKINRKCFYRLSTLSTRILDEYNGQRTAQIPDACIARELCDITE